ncbi:MAG: hypothetical protein LUH58_03200 [Lachnospiraceae bacterium]|nr:hypothetical protein [Lachnospiraceae bacterium]
MEPEEKEIEDILKILDDFTARGESRLKIQTQEDLAAGQTRKAYHLGRCDVGSPWARGQAFDVLEPEKEK